MIKLRGNIMKKITMLLIVCIMCLFSLTVNAAANTQDNPINWEISMMPKPTAEEVAAARWSVIVENDIGIYAYDMDSIQYFMDEDKNIDKNIINVKVKTLFTDKDILKKLKNYYKDKLAKKEKVAYCEMDMQFSIKDKTYLVQRMDVYSDKHKLIESKINKTGFVPVPEKSFAEAMYEICSKLVVETESKNK